jgi:signal transduction histidine kinase
MPQGTDSGSRKARRLAAGLLVVIVATTAGHLVLGVWSGNLAGDEPGTVNWFYVGLTLVAIVMYAGVGWMIVVRQPRNTIGWLLLAYGALAAFALFVGDYATLAVTDPGSVPFGRAAAWADRWLLVVLLCALIPLFLLFPDGRLPSRRWRPALWLTIVGPVLAVVTFALTPGRLTGALANFHDTVVTNPLGVDALAGSINSLTQVAGFASLAAAFLAGAAVVVRYRGASGEVRQQIRWLAFMGVAFLVELVIAVGTAIVLGDEGDSIGNAIASIAFFFMVVTLFVGTPLACGVAILRYRLYDLGIVVRKTLVVALLVAFISLVYAVIVGGLGALIGSGSSTLAFVAAAVLAILFQPARDRARGLADRLVYGKRATPYEVLTEFSGRMAETYDTEDVLPRMASVVREGVGADTAVVWLEVGGRAQAAAVSPPDTRAPAEEPTDAVAVVHQGERLGAISVTMPADDPMTPERRTLVESVAAQAGLMLRNVRLIEELRASRQRLVAAQDEERRKIERNIHDGVQQQLVALSVQLGLVARTAGTDSERTVALATQLQGQATATLEDLRDLARGIYPPLLADKGLLAALEAQARKAAVPTHVMAHEVGRYDPQVEATVYFCALEALNNVAKYAGATAAGIELAQDDGHLSFTVHDDGVGFDPEATTHGTGLQGMADRLAAIGGTLEIVSEPGGGTTVRGRVPA